MRRRITIEPEPNALRLVTGNDERPEIQLTEELSDVTDYACDALANDPEIYQRGGALVNVIQPALSPEDAAPGVPMIRELPHATLNVRLAQIARWLKLEKKSGNWKRVNVPAAIVNAVHARGEWPKVRPLAAVSTAPTMRPNGTVLQTPGYDAATAILYWPTLPFAEVADEPSRDDARNAAEAILDLAVDFPFAESDNGANRSAWLAAVLTLAARHAIMGPCPLFAVDGNTPGAGKSRLVDLAMMIVHGTKAARSSISNKDEELRKQITSLLLEGSPAALFDNIQSGGRFGGPAFDALLTSDVWKDRDLGRLRVLVLPSRAVFFSTGNNQRFTGDLPRRTLRIRLESPLENPEDRAGFKHGEGDALLRKALANRKFLVAQALTILRAHAVAGRPRCGKSWGSFEAWNDIVGGAIRWLGYADPLDARATADSGADETRIAAACVIAAMLSIGRPLTARELVNELYPITRFDDERTPDLFPTFAPARDSLENVTGAKGVPQPTHVGYFLKRIQGRVVGGKAVVSELDRHSKVQRWRIREAGAMPDTGLPA